MVCYRHEVEERYVECDSFRCWKVMRPTESWGISRGVLWGLLALLALPALWPLLSEGFPKTHDGSVHLIRLFLLDEQVRSGNFFPRWLPSLMTGYGYPTFNFYAPFIYGVAELLHLAGVALPSALAVLMGGLVLAAGAGMFLLASDLYADHGPAGRWAGLAAAGVYLYTPYFLVNLYVRGALAELLAQALLPWLFWAVTRVWTRPRPQLYWVGSAVLLGGIAIGHNITLLLLPLLLGPYGVTLLAVLPGGRREFFRRAGGLAVGALVAAGITAFFWLPLLLERNLLSSLAFNAPNLAEHVWSWATVVEPTLPYPYPFSSVPFRLGLVQAALALAGLLWTRRRSPLWWFWVVLGAVAALGITPASLLLWENVDLLRVVQFPWRLLTAVSLSTAILAGGLVLLGRQRPVQVLLASTIALAALLAGRPYVATFDTAMYADIALDPAVIARYEAIYRAWGAGWHREFLPRWAEQFDRGPVEDEPAGQVVDQLSLQAVTHNGLQLTVETESPATLRLNQFFFPGWQATLDFQAPLAVYPSTHQGLVTVDLPAGRHTVVVARTDSAVQVGAEWLTVATLWGLGIVWRRRRWPAAAMAAAGVAAALLLHAPFQDPPQPLTSSQTEVVPGLTLLGYRSDMAENGRSLLLTPYWYNRRTYKWLATTWRLRDASGTVVSQIDSEPYHGTLPAVRWLPGMLVRDGYRLPLPNGQPAGTYQLEMQVATEAGRTDWLALGSVELPAAPAFQPLGILLTDPQSREQVELAGYTVAVDGVEPDPNSRQPLIARPGDLLTVRLYWRAHSELSEDYHSFLHLVSHTRQTLVALDKIPGQELARPRFWDLSYTEPDTYALRIPAEVRSGLYYPRVGFYDYGDLDRFLWRAGEQEEDALDLPPIKIVASLPQPAPQQRVQATYGAFAEVVGYSVTSAPVLQPGDSVTVTLFYRGLKPAEQPYTQFFQLYSPTLGMAAQVDQPPLRGGNPTHTWQRDELIVDQVTLTVAANALSGEYTLNTGLYDPASGERVPLLAASGEELRDRQLPLTTLTVSDP